MTRFSNYKVGDMVNDCTGFNVVITELFPSYRPVGRHGKVLSDVTIYSANNSASLLHCGIEPPKSYEELKAQLAERTKYEEATGDKWGFLKMYQEGALNPDGTFTVKK